MGRGSSGSKGGSGGGGKTIVQVIAPDGTVIDISDMPLVSDGEDMAVSGELRKVLEEQEAKHFKAHTEYCLLTDAEGKPIVGELHGGKTSVKLPGDAVDEAAVLTHNHPRSATKEAGIIGGTFSDADLMTFSHANNMDTIRASAMEGTYSMTKKAGFDGHKFRGYVRSINKARTAELKSAQKKLEHDYVYGNMKMAEFTGKAKANFNQFLVNLHNDLRAGQAQYNYSYTLEGGK